MFGAGWTEMLIIGVVALVVIGPKDLPVVMRKLGRVVATVRRMGDEFQRELNKTTGLDQITDLKRSITEPLRQTSQEIVAEFNKVTTTGVQPSGLIQPTDPKVESVYDQIAATSGLPTSGVASPTGTEGAAATTTPPPVMKPMAPVSPEPSPAPAEASVVPPAAAPTKPKRATRAKPEAPNSEASTEAPKRVRKAVAKPAKAATANSETVEPGATKAGTTRKAPARRAAAVATGTEASVSTKPTRAKRAAKPTVAGPAGDPAVTTGEAVVPSPEKA
ncbi:MAG TPA: Sec-independent protein translocase protein TatB [Devosiaceae bacterium]|nr:Sec-independent protein translocase protein TatB [Devosiaceae bacterium]